MISLESFIRRPLWNVIQTLSGQKALTAEFSFDLSGHPQRNLFFVLRRSLIGLFFSPVGEQTFLTSSPFRETCVCHSRSVEHPYPELTLFSLGQT